MTTTTKNKKQSTSTDLKARKAALAAARGSLAWVKYSVDDFIRDKQDEVERENAR